MLARRLLAAMRTGAVRTMATRASPMMVSDVASGLTDEQVTIQEMARSFADERLAPHAAKWDAEQHFPVDVLREAAELGFGGICVDPEYGGSGLSRVDQSVVFEALSTGDVSTTAYMSIHNMCCSMIDTFGTEEQKRALLPQLTSMETFASYCLTEPGSGSDAGSLATRAVDDGSGAFVVNGSKAFISAAGASGIYLVMTRTDAGITCLVIEKDMPGVSFGQKERKMGWNSQPTRTVLLDNVRVPKANVLGTEGQGFKIAMAGLDGGRINIGSCSLGGAQECFDRAVVYAGERSQFGTPIGQLQNTQFRLADMAVKLMTSRMLLRRAAQAVDDAAEDKTFLSAAAKLFATDNCFDVANQALQIHGGYGYLQDYEIERFVRDLRVHQILEGTNEVMRVILARELQR